MGLVNFAKDGPFTIVDNSYLVHAIAFRTLNIYGKHFDLPDCGLELHGIDFSEDEDFIKIFNRNYVSSIKKLHSQFMGTPSRTIIAQDCSKRKIWRKSFFNEYKLHRIVQTEPPQGLNRGPIFKYVNNDLLPSLEDRGFGHVFYHHCSEADDIIGIAHSIIRREEPDRKIVILASDHDLMQLLDEHTEIFTTQGKSLKDKSLGNPKLDLLQKILIGDKSDGIPACFTKQKGDPLLSRGFGAKACQQLLDDRELLIQKFQEYPEAAEQFKLNTKIVDFNNIPADVRQPIEESIMDKIYG